MLHSLLPAVLFGAAAATATLPTSTPSASAGAPAPVQAAPVAQVLAANTVVELETVDEVSSRTSKPKDFFRMRVAQDVRIGDRVVIPAGTEAMGQVVHAAKSGGGGKAGELILAARSIKLAEGEVKLRSGFGASGRQRIGAALATSIAVGVFGLMVHGKDLVLPAGTPLSARVAADTEIAAALSSGPPASPTHQGTP